MKLRRVPQPAVVALLAGLAAAATAVSAVAQEPTPAVRSFDATQLTPDRYTVLGRLWVQTWHTAFDVSRQAQTDTAITELSAEAAKLGADAITNVSCFNDQGGPVNRGWFCYALAVKLK